MSGESYKFGSYEARISTRELYKGGTRLKLRPQPFQVLVVLLERAGQVVTREDLHQVLWPKDTFVDFERGLNTSIKELRGILSDSASRPRYIETLPKLGYRMIVPVEMETGVNEPVVETIAGEESAALVSPESFPSSATPPVPLARRMGLVLAGGLILLLVMGGAWKWQRTRTHAQDAGARIMLAVLPFENLTGNASQDYLSDGLTEEMISQLGRLDSEHFGVIALTSAMHYRKTQERVDQIGRELGVQYVLEGGLRRDSDQLRISAQLIKVPDKTPVWNRQYDRQWTSLLALQEEIAFEISDEIQFVVEHRKAAPRVSRAAISPQQSEAHDLYLKGLYFWNKRTIEGFEKAIDYFQQAIREDARYAPAYAGIANSYLLLTGYSAAPHPEYMTKARVWALRALEIDGTLPEAHTALATIVRNYDLDWQTAEREYRRAIELNPNYATAHHWYAESLGYLGRFDEALRESERARQLDPFSLIIAADEAVLLYYSRNYDRSIREFRSVMELDPKFPRAFEVVLPYMERGMFREAISEIEQNKWPESPWAVYVYGRSGRPELARRALKKLLEVAKTHPIESGAMVTAYLGAGDKEKALDWLERAYAEHSNVMTYLKVEPEFDPLRGDPRFQNLLRRAGLAR